MGGWTPQTPISLRHWPGVITSLCLDTVSARLGVGHLLLPAQLPGTHWVMICMIWRLALTVSVVCLKLSCFQSTSTYIQHIRGIALYALYEFRTYSLTRLIGKCNHSIISDYLMHTLYITNRNLIRWTSTVIFQPHFFLGGGRGHDTVPYI